MGYDSQGREVFGRDESVMAGVEKRRRELTERRDTSGQCWVVEKREGKRGTVMHRE